MGKRKAAKKVQGPRKREPLATAFTCLFCNHEKAVQVKLDKKAAVGDLWCKVCGQKWQTNINYLSAAVDVYADWIDACETVAQEAVAQEAADRKFSSYATTGRSAAGSGGAGVSAAAAKGGDDEEGEADYDDDE